jgi:hypothetical protein
MSRGSPPSSPASIASRFANNFVLAASTVAILLVVAEIAARVVYHPENLGTVIHYDPTLGWSLKPNSTSRSVDYHRHLDYLIRINSLGMREREVSLVKPSGRRRVLLIGDSVTFGTGVEAGWRFSDFMQRALGDDVEVINAGVPGWGLDQELIYFETFAHRLDPDIVVVTFTVANDVVNDALGHLFLGSAPKPRFILDADSLRLVGVPPESPSDHRPLWKRALRNSRFLLFVKRRIDRWVYTREARLLHHPEARHGGGPIAASGGGTHGTHMVLPGFGRRNGDELTHWSAFENPPCPEMDAAWRVTDALISRFAADCRQQNAALILFALPPRIEVDKRWRTGMMAHAGLDSTDLDFVQPFERLSECCRRNGIVFLHPLEAFAEGAGSRDLYHVNDSHPNRYGHALAARVLLESLHTHQNLHFEIAGHDLLYVDPP